MSFNGQSNTPWRSNVVPYQQMFMQQPPQQSNMAAFGGHGQIFPAVSYPSRTGVNPVAFQQTAGQSQQHYNSIGTVTKMNNDCGLVNDEVFFYRNVCKGHVPKLGDRVLFEATFSTSGQFKWNATRIQLMPQQQPPPLMGTDTTKGSGYNAVPPPNEYRGGQQRHGVSPRRSSPARDRHARNERRERHRSRDRDDEEHDRKRRREDRSRERGNNTSNRNANVASRNERERERDEVKRERDHTERERDREREKERSERAERSPHRSVVKGRRTRTIRRYMVQIPKSLLSYKAADVPELRQRYATLYVPSDFFHANIKWSESFTPDNPFSLRRASQFHIMHKIVEPPFEQQIEHLEPPDADYLYSAKVMLMSMPPITELYQKCFEEDDSDGEQHAVHPSRLISFLVGTRGRNEPMAIGGPWSRSLDGENPDKDPAVLIRTAIRTCKALSGIDLSNCTQWYRFVELYYHRTEYKNKRKDGPPRIETVVIYLPDVHSCMPSQNDWQGLTQVYKNAVDNVIARRMAAFKVTTNAAAGDDDDEGEDKTTLANDAGADDDVDAASESTAAETENDATQKDSVVAANAIANDADDDDGADIAADVAAVGDANENEKEDTAAPKHYSKLDLKTMKVQDIREELTARGLPAKGVRNVLMARLAKALNTEKAEEENTKTAATKTTTEKAQKTAVSNAAPATAAVGEKKAAKPIKTENATTTPAADIKVKNENVAPIATAASAEIEIDNEDTEDWADIIDVDMSDIVILDEYDSSKNPDESPKELDEKEHNQLIRRYTLPNEPQIVVHPNRLAKSGKFDCSIMSLSVLLDYRAEDTKERFFEVSLFAELFNEMLMRDFGFNIYKELYLYQEHNNNSNGAELSELKEADTTNDNKNDDSSATAAVEDTNSKSKENNTHESKSKSDEKSARERRVSKRDEDVEEDSQSGKSIGERKRKSTATTIASSGKEKENAADKKTVVVKPQLLLSFVYFDTTHCGYIFQKDLENLFGILGLNLSRAQISKVLGKLATRQAFYYRKLTDKEESLTATPTIEDADDIPSEELKKIAIGNRQYEHVFGSANNVALAVNAATPSTADDDETGLINYNGAVVHVGKLIEQIKRTEKNCSNLEKLHNDLKKQHSELQKEHSKSTSKVKYYQTEVKSLNRKLSDADQDLFALSRKNKDQLSTLSAIYNRVAPYFTREKDKEHKTDKDKNKDKENKDSKESKESSSSSNAKENKESKSRQDKDNKDVKDKDKEKDKGKDRHRELSKDVEKTKSKNGLEEKKSTPQQIDDSTTNTNDDVITLEADEDEAAVNAEDVDDEEYVEEEEANEMDDENDSAEFVKEE